MKDNEIIKNIPTEDLLPFKNHPFKMRSGEENAQLYESIKLQGTIEPLIARSLSGGKYEIISGHRRFEICKQLGITDVPVIVRNMTDEEAVIMMVDTNLHRENILPSEKAYAYKMKSEALSHQGRTLSQVGTKLRTDELVGKESGESRNQVHRYIRLTYLIPELLKMVDDKEIAFTPAVELSYLTEKEQQLLHSEIEYAAATPSLSQAQRLRNFSKQGRLSRDVIFAVMSEEKANQKERLKIPVERVRKFFPENYTTAQMEDEIIKMCEVRFRKRTDRDSR